MSAGATPRFEDHLAHLARLREAALRAVDPAEAVRRFVTEPDLAGAERVFIAGAGKAGVAMARAAARIAGPRLAAGVLSVPHLPEQPVDRVEFIAGGHPLPTAGSLAAGRAIASLLSKTKENDLVLALISGGGSALLELPRCDLGLDDLQAATTALLKSGAAIHEFNTVRAHLSRIKGGGLARLAQPARVLSLILSDVVGNPLDIIASGPTVPAPSTRQDALDILDRYGLRAALPPAVVDCLSGGESGASSGEPDSQPRVENRLIGSNRLAGEAAAEAARELGFETSFVADDWQGEAREVGARFSRLVLEGARGRQGPRCWAAGGESTVTVRGQGKGGRNQEAALAAALAIAGQPDLVIAMLATDGVDGPTDAAGAVVTGGTLARARAQGRAAQQYLDDNNAYAFFDALDGLIRIGPTGTNVNDLMFGLAY